MTLSKEFFDANRSVVNQRIRSDQFHNDDGSALILVDDKHVVLMNLASMDITPILMILNSRPWARMFLHQRMATGGSPIVGNCHGWATRDDGAVHVMHNGILHTSDSVGCAVDSQAILTWLEQLKWKDALGKIEDEWYANVFLIINGRGHTIIRSETGSLVTDGLGNFSTNYVTGLHHEVPVGAFGTGAVTLTWKMIHAAEDKARTRMTAPSRHMAYTSTGSGGGGELWVPDKDSVMGLRRIAPTVYEHGLATDEPPAWRSHEKTEIETMREEIRAAFGAVSESERADRQAFRTAADIAGEDDDDDMPVPVDVAIKGKRRRKGA